MNEEELNEAIEELKKATQDYHKMSENCLYFDEYQYTNLMNLAYKLENELKQEKEENRRKNIVIIEYQDLLEREEEKNKKLEEEYAKAIESEADIAVGSHKLINNLAQAIRFMSSNEKLTVEDIIKEFSKENKVTEEFMERWEKSQYEESHLKDKVIDLVAEKLRDLKDDIDTLHEGEIDCFIPKDFCDINGCAKYKDCADCIKEYYFNKVKENEK